MLGEAGEAVVDVMYDFSVATLEMKLAAAATKRPGGGPEEGGVEEDDREVSAEW